MIFGYCICLVLAIVLFFLTPKWSLGIRFFVAILTFLSLAIIFTVAISHLKDNPVGESRAITKEEINKWNR